MERRGPGGGRVLSGPVAEPGRGLRGRPGGEMFARRHGDSVRLRIGSWVLWQVAGPKDGAGTVFKDKLICLSVLWSGTGFTHKQIGSSP